ncbi:MAG: hypothetical protein AABW80_00425 [Nanoarchaeota archaeon]
MTEKDKLENFMKDIKEANERKDIRKTILLLGIYSEYIVNELLKLKFGYCLDKGAPAEYKIKILRATKIIEESEYKVLLVLNGVRNRYAPDLEIDLSKIKGKMRGLK